MKDILVELHAGEGGSDSKLFVKDLRHAYCKYAERHNLSWEIVTNEPSYSIILLSGKDARSRFKHESGKHCVQRVPPTERGSRSHTSIISVAVLPVLEHTDIILNPDDLEIQATKGSGPGGQNKNKSKNMIRMKHVPTGFVACVDGRDYQQNRKMALSILTARVNDCQQTKDRDTHNARRQRQLDGKGRGNKIRTYNFIKQRVVDHRLNAKTRRIDDVMKGNFDLILTQ